MHENNFVLTAVVGRVPARGDLFEERKRTIVSMATMALQAPVRTYTAYDFELSLSLGLRLKTGTLEVVGVEPRGQAEAFLGTMNNEGSVWAICTVDGLPVRSHQQFDAALARAQRAVDNGAHRRTVNLGFQSIVSLQNTNWQVEGNVRESESADIIHNHIIIVDGFPHFESDWRGVPVTPIVIASALHKTYNVRTNPSMVTFVDDISRTSCYVELSSIDDARRILLQYEKGASPTLHHRDEDIADWILSVSVAPLNVVIPRRANGLNEVVANISGLAQEAMQAPVNLPVLNLSEPVLILEGFPSVNNPGWNGVRVNEVVVASMLHRTYGIRTNPGMVSFLDDERTANTRSCRVELSSVPDAHQVLAMYLRGKRPSLHGADGQRSENLFNLIIRSEFPDESENAVLNLLSSFNEQLRMNERSRNPQEIDLNSSTASGLNNGSKNVSTTKNETERLVLTGLPGPHPAWRFVNDKVVASLIHRTFGVRTNSNAVLVAADRRSCQLDLSSLDARHVMLSTTKGQNIILEHRDSRMKGLDLKIEAESPSLKGYLEAVLTAEKNRKPPSQHIDDTIFEQQHQNMVPPGLEPTAWIQPISKSETNSSNGLSIPSWTPKPYENVLHAPNLSSQIKTIESLNHMSSTSVYGFEVEAADRFGAVSSNTGLGAAVSPRVTSTSEGYSYFS